MWRELLTLGYFNMHTLKGPSLQSSNTEWIENVIHLKKQTLKTIQIMLEHFPPLICWAKNPSWKELDNFQEKELKTNQLSK